MTKFVITSHAVTANGISKEASVTIACDGLMELHLELGKLAVNFSTLKPNLTHNYLCGYPTKNLFLKVAQPGLSTDHVPDKLTRFPLMRIGHHPV